MEGKRVTALPDSPTQLWLWDTPGSKLNQSSRELLSSKQRVVGSNPSRDAFSYKSP